MSTENEQPSPAADALAPTEQVAIEQAAPVAEVAAEPIPPNPLNDAIDAWFVTHFHDSIASRNAEIFNHCLAAKEDLKRRVAAL